MNAFTDVWYGASTDVKCVYRNSTLHGHDINMTRHFRLTVIESSNSESKRFMAGKQYLFPPRAHKKCPGTLSDTCVRLTNE
jgi:hypothetical protein